jgi:glycosyltransferase involved in cell wall biosynthesis
MADELRYNSNFEIHHSSAIGGFIILHSSKMTRKRILIFIDWFTPGYKAGGPITSNANLIDHLKDDLEFYVITRNTDYCESIPYDQVASDAWNILPNGAHVYYISKKQLSFSQLIKITKSINFDYVFVNGIYSLYFSLFPIVWFKYFSKKKLVVSARGMLSDHTFSSKKLKKKIYYVLLRFINLYGGIVFHATNDEELSQIRKNLGFKGDIKVAPNLPPKGEYQLFPIQKTNGELRLISIARISPEKNTLFALKILYDFASANNQLSATININFDLYGTIYSQVYWSECKQVIEMLPSNICVSFCGPLEKEKVHETIQANHFLFMPSQGENYGHSVIESLLAGRPVIISDRTPWRNLQKSNDLDPLDPPLAFPSPLSPIGWDLPLEEPQKFLDALTLCILMTQADFDLMSKSAHEYAKTILNNTAIIQSNLNLFA